ncbi:MULTISPECIES: hypothetical protein [unclassified Mucilaginibacter]|uniref:hypothetical protein n=1 Tax=unclassified Mucilaginibacter TaxID=2617802 RepID=UPI00138CA8A2|nr:MULTISPECIES: hypothetical protein [unclassified Mucilaginibacter]MBB5394382.1 hypothetical protein [Mucilaginibacter sp. AK015]QHS57209.1 hypothetical protein GWR56_17305 [Mucilaginibacter sp. 14171R-50]
MEQQFEAVLTGSDTPVNGIVTQINNGIYQFNALDGSLQLTIARNEHGNWERIGGSEPFFSGWVDELAEQVKGSL